jgi:FlaA1/EpsC-like NDP-sugar epimerase
VVAVSFWTACLLRFEFSIPARERLFLFHGFLIVLAIKGPVFCLLRLQLDRWPRYAAFADLVSLIRVNAAGSMLASLAIYSLAGGDFPRSVCCLDLLVCILLSGGVRFAARLFHELRVQHPAGTERGLLVYGAGVAGLELAREIRSNPKLGYRVIGFLDDDHRKHGAQLLGLPVLGSGDEAARIVAAHTARGFPVEEIVVSMPSATGRQIRSAVHKGRSAGVPCRIVPGLGELISGKLHFENGHEISVTDLLGREPVHLDPANVRRAVSGRAVLVTGAAGSIGSELCNQLAQLAPSELIALDQAESGLFSLEAELRDRYPGLSLSPEIGDIRDTRRMEEIVVEHRVYSIFHAAAYKHVPVMERHACEAVSNNVIGTWNLAQTAWRCNVSRFLMISTDKAVNPSSVMGLTKRVAELIVTASRPTVGRGTGTRFVCVRFGNVLVSNGSVVPIFKKQIAAGGPVTVTHPDMRRYFMTVQEASQLVLEASALGKGSEIFMLDMGRPVKIVDLARKMIQLRGLVPDEDVEIRFVGVRPGEKLFEELALGAESLLPTSHDKIRIFQCRQLTFRELAPWVAELQHLLWRRDPDAVLSHLRVLVPEYQPMADQAPASVEQTAPLPAVSAPAKVYAGGAA